MACGLDRDGTVYVGHVISIEAEHLSLARPVARGAEPLSVEHAVATRV